MAKFPQLIHVAEEDGDPPYLVILSAGIFDIDEPDQPIAIYERVETGRVVAMQKADAEAQRHQKDIQVNN